ncbi:MAG: VWA domain-containing protein [Acidimicrobiia bacterium]|nr:VWA domain-containing protein [Acidimicrobiia bacterium]
MTTDTSVTGSDVLGALVGFGRALRHEGLAVGSGRLVTYAQALAGLDPSDPDDLYWAGRACLISHHDDVAAYDRAFRRWLAGGPGGELKVSGVVPRRQPTLNFEPPAATTPGRPSRPESPRGSLASSAEVLRQLPFAECTPDELAALATLMSRLHLDPPLRRSRRTAAAARGRRLDLRRSLRRSLRTHGELLHPTRRARRLRPRRVVLVLDVSGSMRGCSRALLQFAQVATARRPRSRGSAAAPPTEVFCFGTRLTRITPQLALRRPDEALARAADAVVDWEGGTRIGDSLGELVRVWGRRGLVRGAVVIICSDGLERGDPDVLAGELARLARLAHRIVWVNPLKADPRYQPLAQGMHAALPFVDVFVSGHDLSSLESLAGLLPSLR